MARTAEVTPRTDRLVAAVRARCQARGAKAALARYLGVPAQRVNDWLNEGKHPGTEHALAMQEWLLTEKP